MKYSRCLMAAGTLVAMSVALPWAAAADPNPPRSTDDESHKSADIESTQDYDRALLGDSTAKTQAEIAKPQGKAEKSAEAVLHERLQRELGAAAKSETANKPPVTKVVESMRDVQSRLTHRDAGETTQHIEDQIVHDLDQLIEQARNSSGGQGEKSSISKKSPGPKGNQRQSADNQKVAAPHENPTQASSETRTDSRPSNTESDARDFRTLVKRLWGELPETERQQMLALPDEEFLPQYEEQTKQYLRRLSDGKKRSEPQQ